MNNTIEDIRKEFIKEHPKMRVEIYGCFCDSYVKWLEEKLLNEGRNK